MPRSEQSVALEWLGLMRKELEKLKAQMDWLDRGLSYLELHVKQEILDNPKEEEKKQQ